MKLCFILSLFLLILILNSCNLTPTLTTPEEVTVGASSTSYECKSRGIVVSCDAGISSTGKTCYYFNAEGTKKSTVCTEGWKEYVSTPEQDNAQNQALGGKNMIVVSNGIRYHCYSSKGYCLKDGDITQPKVSLSEVVG